MGCFDSCLRCLSLVPWATLIATVMCWAGTALFCGTGHEALKNSAILFNNTIESWNGTQVDNVFQAFRYSLYGIAAFMFVLSLLLLIDGIVVTKTVKSDYEDSCRTSCYGICTGIFYTIITYLVSVAWLVMTCFAVLPIYFFLMAKNQCDANTEDDVCLNFAQLGLIKDSGINGAQICGSDLTDFCDSPQFQLSFQLFIIAFAGSAIVLLSQKQFLMSLSANHAYIKMVKKLSIYEDAKYREEMELNDIINTARSNERLTYKY